MTTPTSNVTPAEIIKPGYTTTEFWGLAFVHLLAAIATVFALTNHSFDATRYAPIIPTAALIAAGVGQLAYAQSRAKVKSAVLGALVAATTARGDLTSGNIVQAFGDVAPLVEEVKKLAPEVADAVAAFRAVSRPSPTGPRLIIDGALPVTNVPDDVPLADSELPATGNADTTTVAGTTPQ